jgi:hypothetical protein
VGGSGKLFTLQIKYALIFKLSYRRKLMFQFMKKQKYLAYLTQVIENIEEKFEVSS